MVAGAGEDPRTPTGRTEAARRIREAGLIAIIRGDFTSEALVEVAAALMKGGVRVLEITLDGPEALEGIARVDEALGTHVFVGAGTVRTPEHVDRAVDAGAKFLVSPNFDPASVQRSRAADVLHLPGVFTATECENAFRAGCDLVKLFPADMLGARYVKALRAPLPDIGFVPTGGITPDDLPAYVRAGAVAFGVGSALVEGPGHDPAELTRRAILMTRALERARGAA